MEIAIETKTAIMILDQLEKSIFQEIRNCIQKYSNMIETMVKDKAPTDTGHLKQMVNNQLIMDASQIVGSVGTNLPYGFWQHEGTKPHWIPFYNAPTYSPESGVKNYMLIKWAERHGFNVDGQKDFKGGWIKKPMRGLYVSGKANPYILESYEFYEGMFQAEISKVVEKAVKSLNGRV